MGKPCFFRIIKFFAVALLGAAATIAAIAVLSSPVAARPGEGDSRTEKPWDTDNLAYSTYSARNFRVPHHQYSGYAAGTGSTAAKAACRTGGIADGFFQTDTAPGRNDFPELKKVSGVWQPTATGSKTSGCAAFVDAQLAMAERARDNGGFYLDSAGKLQKADVGSRFLVAPASRTFNYRSWGSTTSHGFSMSSRLGIGASRSGFTGVGGTIPQYVSVYGSAASRSGSGCFAGVDGGGLSAILSPADYYLARTDNQSARVSSPQPSGAWEPSAAALSVYNEYVILAADNITWYALAHLGVCGEPRFLWFAEEQGSDTNAGMTL